MAQKNGSKNIAQEIAALKKQFDGIKSDTEAFVKAAKRLSNQGTNEAKELLDSAKDNWHGIVSAFEKSPIAKFFSKSKKANIKKAAKKVKKGANTSVSKMKKKK